MSPAESASALLASLPEGATPQPWYASDILDTGGMRPGWGVVTEDNSMLVGARVHRADAYLLAAAPLLRDHLTAALEREAQLRERLAWTIGRLDEIGQSMTFTLGMCRSLDDCRRALTTPGASDV